MSFDGLFNPLWLDADVTHSGGVGFLCPLSPDQPTLTDPGHGFHLAVGFTGVQKLNCMMQLTSGVFSGSTLMVVGILSGDCFSHLGMFHNHASFVLSEGQHDRQNEISGQGVLNEVLQVLFNVGRSDILQFGDLQLVLKVHEEEGSVVIVPLCGSGTEPSQVTFHLEFSQTISCEHKKSPFHGCPQKGDW